MQSAYAALERLGNGKRIHKLSEQDKYSGLYVAGARVVGRSRTILPETRASFYYAWGITPDLQEQLELILDSRTNDLKELCIESDHQIPSILDFLPKFEQQ
jgi:hypothetical protein